MDPMTMQLVMNQLRSRGQGAAGVLTSLFNNPRRPYGNYERRYDEYLNKGVGAYEPYNQAGRGAINPFNQRLGEMSNPSGFINNIMQGYSESPWAKHLRDTGLNAITNNASAEGTYGSTPYGRSMQDYATDISSRDQQNWLKNVLGINTEYLEGENQNINRGLNAATGEAALYGSAAPYQGEAEYGKERASNVNFGNLLQGFLKMLLG